MENRVRIARELARIARILVAKDWKEELLSKRADLRDAADEFDRYMRNLHNPEKEEMIEYWVLEKQTIDFPFSKKTSNMINNICSMVQHDDTIDFQKYDSPQKMLEEVSLDDNRPDDWHEQEMELTKQHPKLLKLFYLNLGEFTWKEEQELVRILLKGTQDSIDYYLDRGQNGINDLFAVKEMIDKFPGITLEDFGTADDLKRFQKYNGKDWHLLNKIFKNDPQAVYEILKTFIKDGEPFPKYFIDLIEAHNIKLSDQLLYILESSDDGIALLLAAKYETDPDRLNMLITKTISEEEYYILYKCMNNKNINKKSLEIILNNINDSHFKQNYYCQKILLKITEDQTTEDWMLKKIYEVYNINNVGNEYIIKNIVKSQNVSTSILLDILHSGKLEQGDYYKEIRSLILKNKKLPVKDAIDYYNKNKNYKNGKPSYIGRGILNDVLQRNDVPSDFIDEEYQDTENNTFYILHSPSCPESIIWDILKNRKEHFGWPEDFKKIKNLTPEMLLYIYNHANEYEFYGNGGNTQEQIRSDLSDLPGFPKTNRR